MSMTYDRETKIFEYELEVGQRTCIWDLDCINYHGAYTIKVN